MAGKTKKDVKRRHVPYTKFKALMQEQNIKQKELAVLLNKTITAVNQNLNGTGGDFSMSEVRKICLAYNISCDTFFIKQKVS
jgi:transcriptional regulator with XRE-family HTH domain